MKTNVLRLGVVCLIVNLLAGCAPASPTPIARTWPAESWTAAAPEAQGMDAVRLAEALARIHQEQLAFRSLLVIRNGVLVTEAYFNPYQADTPVRLQSITKSVIGALVGLAIEQSYLQSADQKLLDFFPGQAIAHLDADKQAITLKHLLTMTSGLDCADSAGTAGAMMQSPDWAQFVLDLPMAEAPGQTFRYCSGNAHLLSVILQKATGQTAREFANTALFAPLGIPAIPEAGWVRDPQGYSDGSSGLYLTPQNIARLGWLYATNGKWDDQQVIPAAWVTVSLEAHIPKGDGSSYGYLWTVYPGEDHAAALGLGGQQLHLYPRHNLVVVLTAGLPVYDQIPDLAGLLEDHILGAVQSASPLAENPAGTGQLQAAIAQAANPHQAVKPSPDVAQEISGKVYRLEANPLGYTTLALTFARGSDQADLIINDFPPFAVGLDHVYRVSPNPGTDLKVAVRGQWLDDGAFEIQSGIMGELSDTRARLMFAAGQITVEITDAVFGNPIFTLQGQTGE